ncbi:ribbon-helix-helix domain-containing protein [Ensifer aridi]|uniref:ribbon-helix-helix domain-containing protein n=1 Tax=Ensifer aridi TaxID=1708715 RepID=UPI001FCD8420|nr:ribbon-helix-helix domain-containing protein [Ensifer aridi]
MTKPPKSKQASRMGRPPLNVKPLLVRLPEGVAERIDALVGKNKRAEFIRDAVMRALAERDGAAPDGEDENTP